MDSRHDHRDVDATDSPVPGADELRAVLAEGDREVTSGQSVPFADIMRELDDAVSRIKARRAARAS